MRTLCLTWPLFDGLSQELDKAVSSGPIQRSIHSAMVPAMVVYKTWTCTPALEEDSGRSVPNPPPEESRSHCYWREDGATNLSSLL